MQKLGIIAGSGYLPVCMAKEVKAQGRIPIVVSITKSAHPELSKVAEQFRQCRVFQVKKIIDHFLDAGVKELALIGRPRKSILFNPLKVDLKALKILAKAKIKSDHSLLDTVVTELESDGFTVIDQRTYLSSLLCEPGVLTKRSPRKKEMQDVEYGLFLARKISDLDIGQTVVVKDQMPLAIEAIEGTDEAIRRGGKLGGKGVVVVKVARSEHDFRFDVPTVGPKTIDVMAEVGAKVLAIEAERTFVVDLKSIRKKAEPRKICVVAVASMSRNK